MSWLVGLLRFIPGLGSLFAPLARIGELIAKAEVEKSNAVTAQDKIRADVVVEQLKRRRDVLMVDPYGALIRFGFSAPYMIYFGKLILWDKVLGLGATDSLSPELSALGALIIGFYFLQVARKK